MTQPSPNMSDVEKNEYLNALLLNQFTASSEQVSSDQPTSEMRVNEFNLFSKEMDDDIKISPFKDQ